MPPAHPEPEPGPEHPTLRAAWPAAVAWAAGWAALWALDGRVDLANLAMVVVLAAAVASLWLPVALSVAASAAAVAGFNWAFVPPRGSFTVDLHQHALLLVAMLGVNGIVAVLMARVRGQARQAQRHAALADELRRWGDTLRDAAEPLAQAGALQALLAARLGGPVALLLLREGLPAQHDDEAVLEVGTPDADQRAGLWLCLRQGQPMGPGTGHHDELPTWTLPLRGRGASFGAAVLAGLAVRRRDDALRAHVQALCDQMGTALQRALALRDERRARDEAQSQSVRNALLAAISHDYRTPLATIVGAASSIEAQDDRLQPEQRRRLARSIVDEAGQLARLADNTLQLARLDAPGVRLQCDWESAEELVGVALRRARQREAGARVRARLEPALPLLWCDALLLAQALDNLVDNALKHSAPDTPVEILVRRLPEQVLLAVRDRGPGVAPAWRERIFEVFHRGAEPAVAPAAQRLGAGAAAAQRPGAGVGLAVCRAIARAHGGELRLRARGHGGSSFEFLLPLRTPPEVAEAPP